MDPILHTYTPNAGAQRPAVMGRNVQRQTFDMLLCRTSARRTGQSMIITGLGDIAAFVVAKLSPLGVGLAAHSDQPLSLR